MIPLFSHTVLSDIIGRHFEMYFSILNSVQPNPDGINWYIRSEDEFPSTQRAQSDSTGWQTSRKDCRSRRQAAGAELPFIAVDLSTVTPFPHHCTCCSMHFLIHYLPHSSCKSFPPPSRLHKYLVSYLFIQKIDPRMRTIR